MFRSVTTIEFPADKGTQRATFVDDRSMRIELGRISALFRYPVKSMAGERLDSARLGWHGLEGGRRLALRRLVDRGAFPWLTASRLPELLLDQPIGRQETTAEPLPTHIRTPDGKEYGLADERLVKDLDPDTAEANADVMKTVIRMNENDAGIYATVVRTGELCVGQVVGLRTS
jgi:hypothetical protein